MFAGRNHTMALVALLFTLTAGAPLSHLSSRSGSNYSLIADYSGNTFFDNFDTFSGADPTGGFVDYANMQEAAHAQYLGFIENISLNSTTAYIGVQHANITPDGRGSVRLSSKQTFSAGSLFVLDVLHAPVAYGTWPAAWLLGSTAPWPASGEIDILEWVHETPYNSMTLHTAPGCTVNNVSAADAFQGTLLQTDCNAGDNGALGCSMAAYAQDALTGNGNSSDMAPVSNDTLATAGSAFNAHGGGVYVTEWSSTGVTVWLFARDALPDDLALPSSLQSLSSSAPSTTSFSDIVITSNPNPAGWTQTPLAQFTGTGCDFATSFSAMNFILDITFCGSWAGQAAVWDADARAATGAATCEDWVRENPDAFGEAYFEIGGLSVYSSEESVEGEVVL